MQVTIFVYEVQRQLCTHVHINQTSYMYMVLTNIETPLNSQNTIAYQHMWLISYAEYGWSLYWPINPGIDPSSGLIVISKRLNYNKQVNKVNQTRRGDQGKSSSWFRVPLTSALHVLVSDRIAVSILSNIFQCLHFTKWHLLFTICHEAQLLIAFCCCGGWLFKKYASWADHSSEIRGNTDY